MDFLATSQSNNKKKNTVLKWEPLKHVFFVEESPHVIEFPSENSGGLMSFICMKTNAKHR